LTIASTEGKTPARRHYRTGGSAAATRSAANLSDCGNRCAYVDNTVFGSSPRRAATMWTGTLLVNANVAAECLSVCSVPDGMPAALRCCANHWVSRWGWMGPPSSSQNARSPSW
jgi:hypothetical protein